MSDAQQLTTRDRVTHWLLNRLSVSRWRRESQAARFDKQFWTDENGQLFFIPEKTTMRWGSDGISGTFLVEDRKVIPRLEAAWKPIEAAQSEMVLILNLIVLSLGTPGVSNALEAAMAGPMTGVVAMGLAFAAAIRFLFCYRAYKRATPKLEALLGAMVEMDEAPQGFSRSGPVFHFFVGVVTGFLGLGLIGLSVFLDLPLATQVCGVLLGVMCLVGAVYIRRGAVAKQAKVDAQLGLDSEFALALDFPEAQRKRTVVEGTPVFLGLDGTQVDGRLVLRGGTPAPSQPAVSG